MTRLFLYETGDAAYLDLLRQVHDHGEVHAPRGQKTWYLDDVTIEIEDPLFAPPNDARPGFSERIAATELVQLLAGVSCLPQLDAASGGRFSRFANGGRLLGAYGPRLRDQLPRVCAQLKRDHDTRQAIATLWRPNETAESADVPCTVYLLFRIREDALELKVHMRSNDVWLGVPYDWYVFSRLQLAMAAVLDLEPGLYVHHVDNLHLYERDDQRGFDAIKRAIQRAKLGDQVDALPEFSRSTVHDAPGDFETWSEVQATALRVLRHDTRVNWFTERVTPLADEDVVCPTCHYVVPDGHETFDLDDGACSSCYMNARLFRD